jgi:hypothetical protein
MPLLGLLVFEAMLVAVGLLVARLVLPRGTHHPAELWLPLSFAIGLLANALLMKVSLLLTGHYSPWLYTLLAFAAVLLLGILWNSDRLASLGGFGFLARSGPQSTRAPARLLTILVFALIIMLHAEALRFPLFTWDGRFIWNLKAMILLHEGTIFGESFMDPERIHFHRDYPLLLPGAYLGIYHLSGGVADRMARLFLVHLSVMLFLAFHGSLRSRCAPWIAMAFTALLAESAFRMDYTVRDGISLTTGVADFPFAFFLFLAAWLHLRGWRTSNPRWHLLGGLMTGACLLTKSEGLVVFAALCVVNLLAARWLRRRPTQNRLKHFTLAVAVPLAVVAPWLLLKASLPNFYDEKFGDLIGVAGLAPLIQRLPRVLSLIAFEVTSIRAWNLTWFLFPVAFMVAIYWRGRRLHWLPGAAAILIFSGYFLAYLSTPLEIHYHVETSIGRLLSHVYPLALFQLAAAIGLGVRLIFCRQDGESAQSVLQSDPSKTR